MRDFVIRLANGTELPPALDAPALAHLFGVGVDHVYALVRAGDCPVEPLRWGRCLRWPTVPVLKTLGLDHLVVSADALEAA